MPTEKGISTLPRTPFRVKGKVETTGLSWTFPPYGKDFGVFRRFGYASRTAIPSSSTIASSSQRRTMPTTAIAG